MDNNCNTRCRTCLTEEESFTHFLFQSISAKTFMFCTSIDVSQDDKLSKAFCDSCYELLTKFSDFKYVCLQSHEKLLSQSITEQNKNNFHDCILSDQNNIFEVHSQVGGSDFKPESSNLMTKVKFEDYNLYNDDEPQTAEFSFEEINVVNKKLNKPHKRLKKVKKTLKKRPNIIRHFAYECESCNKKFNHQDRFEAHKLLHEGKTTSINCLPCNKTFMTWSGLYRHNESSHSKVDLNFIQCNVCGKVCKSRQTLRVHMKMHGERSICICNVCGKGFTSDVVLKTHLETHKNYRERRYTCEHCGKKFFTNATLRSHISRCHTTKRYICDVCTYPFTDKYNLSKHLLIHEGKHLKFRCEVCNKSYTCNSSLIEHKRVHSGERPFVCSYCPKCFRSKRRLNDHHKIHTGERPHKCDLCTQAFTQRGTLIRHIKVHNRKTSVATSTST